MSEFSIGKRKIGKKYPPLVIAEIGINHGGSLRIAKEMVDSAYRAGVEAIKHQTHIVDDEMSPEAKKVIPGNTDISIYEVMERCALNESDEYELLKYVESKGMIFLSTPFGRAAADRLMEFKINAFKIGSGECNNVPLIKHIANFEKPMIVSTGMNTIDMVKPTVQIIREKGTDFALLHTTNLYPTPNHLVRLGAMQQLEQEFECVIGLSDHTTSNHACLGAVALGASILERHFTDVMTRKGPDIVCSMDEKTCFELIEGANILFEQRGGEKTFLSEEQVTRDFAFASVCAIKEIEPGEIFDYQNLWVKRPGIGELPANRLESTIGRMATRHIKKGEHLRTKDVQE